MILSRLFAPRAKMSVDEVLRRLDAWPTTSSGAVVTEQTALAQATVYSCVKILSESIASLPLGLYRKVSEKTTQQVLTHDALDVMAAPNAWMTQHELVQFWVAHQELRGNAYSFKARAGGRVKEILPLHPSAVSVRQNPDWSIVYTVGSDKDASGECGPDRVMHLRNFGSESYVGLSTIGLHREAIGLALQTEKHGAVLFKNGAQMGAILEAPSALSDQAYERLKKSLEEEHGGVVNAHKSLILEEGLKASRIGMTNEDSQFLETRRFQKQEIAAIFGVPLFLLNDTEKSTTWGSGLEQIGRAFVNFTLKPRLSRLTQVLGRELLTREERRDHFFAFDTDEFTLGTIKERFEAWASGITNGVISPNEARAWEKLNPRAGGDEYLQPLNLGASGTPAKE